MRTKLITAAIGALLLGGSTFAKAHGPDDLFRLLPHPQLHDDDWRRHDGPRWNDAHRDYRIERREHEYDRYRPHYHDRYRRDHGRFFWHRHDRD